MEQKPSVAYLFDIDGVLTNPEAKSVEHPALFGELIRRLEQEKPIGLNTGRSLNFIVEKVLEPIEAMVPEKRLLQNIIGVGEMGGIWITYSDKGKRMVDIDKNLSVPQEIQDEVRALVNQLPYSETMFYDDTKRTMVSVELLSQEQRAGKSFEDFQASQRQLVEDLRALLARHNKERDFKVTATRIATDLDNVRVGKALGAHKFVDLLRAKRIEPRAFLGFGDSASDYEMYQELKRLGKQAQFVFVGGREHLAGKPEEGIIFTEEYVDKGTLEFLRQEKE